MGSEYVRPDRYLNDASAIDRTGVRMIFKKLLLFLFRNLFRILDLNERFAKRGFNKATFVIILPLPADEDPENSTLPTLVSETGNVSVIYENEDLEHLPVDSVTVIDACGIVVYSIILPWSSMQYPYVKAAILSAMFDQPCGTCEKVMELT